MKIIWKVMALNSFGDDRLICSGSWLKCKLRAIWLRILGFDIIEMERW
jgi:hypothetical protein